MEQESHAFHTRVADAFVEATTHEWQANHPEIGPVEHVDARGDVDVVLQRCLDVLSRRWPDRFSTLTTTPPAGQPAHRDRAERISDTAALTVGTND